VPVKALSINAPSLLSKWAGTVKKREDEPSLLGVDAVAAKYRIELTFSRHRSSLAHKPSPFALLIWESGKRFHGGGDQKMYWCGYDDCRAPITSDNFGYAHVVCPKCTREQFLDPDSRKSHIANLRKENRPLNDIDKLPMVVGEMLFNMTPENTAELILKTWRALGGDADVYLKWSPYEIMYDPKSETTKTMDNLNKVRIKREPVLYPLSRILKDVNSGADLKLCFKALLTC
jgi:hypothetical protein